MSANLPMLLIFLMLMKKFFHLRSENSLHEILIDVFFSFNKQLASKVTIMASLINWAATSKLSNV